MSQTTLGDDDLFDEAASEMREEVEEHLEATRAALPDAAAVWESEADNVLGVLNGLKSALDAGDAIEHLRQAKKQFVMGKRADAFEDADDLEEAIEELEEIVSMLDEASEQVGALTATVPELRGALQGMGDEDEDEDD
jgi:dsDNA-specific endonuclease/ATPase MutS2